MYCTSMFDMTFVVISKCFSLYYSFNAAVYPTGLSDTLLFLIHDIVFVM